MLSGFIFSRLIRQFLRFRASEFYAVLLRAFFFIRASDFLFRFAEIDNVIGHLSDALPRLNHQFRAHDFVELFFRDKAELDRFFA